MKKFIGYILISPFFLFIVSFLLFPFYEGIVEHDWNIMKAYGLSFVIILSIVTSTFGFELLKDNPKL